MTGSWPDGAGLEEGGEGYQEAAVAWCHLCPTLERADPVGGDGKSSMGRWLGVSLLGMHIALRLLDEWPPRTVFWGLPGETNPCLFGGPHLSSNPALASQSRAPPLASILYFVI